MSNDDVPTSSMHSIKSLPDGQRRTKGLVPRLIDKWKGKSTDRVWSDDIEEELTLSGTALSCYWLGTIDPSGQPSNSFDSAGISSRGLSRDDSSELMFSIGSVIKLLISVCLIFLIDDPFYVRKALDADKFDNVHHLHEPNKAPKLQKLPADAWSKNAFELLAAARKSRNSEARMYVPKHAKFTLLDVMRHNDALPSMQDLLLGPQSTFLMTMEWFVSHIGQIYEDEREKSRQPQEFGYSNANYIFLGALIEAVTGLDLATALQKIVLNHPELNMKHTLLSVDKYKELEHLVVEGNFVDVEPLHERLTIKISTYLQNSAALACCGGFSCTKDIASLLGFLIRKKTTERWRWIFEIPEESRNPWTLSGKQCPLNDKFTTEQSYERCLLGADDFKSEDRKSFPKMLALENDKYVIVKAGAVTGYSSVYYLLPAQNMFIVVLSNSSGIIDSASRIAHILAKRRLGLDSRGDFRGSRSDLRKKRQQRMEACLLKAENHVSIDTKFKGRYTHFPSGQVVVVDRNSIEIVGTDGDAQKLSETNSFVSLGKNEFAIWTEPGCRGLDRYDVWRHPKMMFIDNGTNRYTLKLQSRCYEGVDPEEGTTVY